MEIIRARTASRQQARQLSSRQSAGNSVSERIPLPPTAPSSRDGHSRGENNSATTRVWSAEVGVKDSVLEEETSGLMEESDGSRSRTHSLSKSKSKGLMQPPSGPPPKRNRRAERAKKDGDGDSDRTSMSENNSNAQNDNKIEHKRGDDDDDDDDDEEGRGQNEQPEKRKQFSSVSSAEGKRRLRKVSEEFFEKEASKIALKDGYNRSDDDDIIDVDDVGKGTVKGITGEGIMVKDIGTISPSGHHKRSYNHNSYDNIRSEYIRSVDEENINNNGMNDIYNDQSHHQNSVEDDAFSNDDADIEDGNNSEDDDDDSEFSYGNDSNSVVDIETQLEESESSMRMENPNLDEENKYITPRDETDEAHSEKQKREMAFTGGSHTSSQDLSVSNAKSDGVGGAGATLRYLASFGRGEHGRLGNGHVGELTVPTPIRSFCDVHQIAAGRDHTVALSKNGHVWTWGLGHDGRLGLGDEESREHPTRISCGPCADQFVTGIAVGEYHSLAVTATRRLFTWGRGYYGRLGHGDTLNRYLPEMVRSLSHLQITGISAGVSFSMATTELGKLYTWGYGGHGQLGHGETKNYIQPELVRHGLEDEIVTVSAAGYGHSMAVTAKGELYTWGSGHGLLGHSDDNQRLTPAKVVALEKKEIREIAAGYDHSLAVSSVGDLYTWGNGGYGQLGQGEGNHCIGKPELVQALSGQQCVSVAAGEYHSIAITAVGTAYSWGHGGYGQLGHGNFNNCYTPQIIADLESVHVVSAAAGGVHSLLCIEGTGGLNNWSVEDIERESLNLNNKFANSTGSLSSLGSFSGNNTKMMYTSPSQQSFTSSGGGQSPTPTRQTSTPSRALQQPNYPNPNSSSSPSRNNFSAEVGSGENDLNDGRIQTSSDIDNPRRTPKKPNLTVETEGSPYRSRLVDRDDWVDEGGGHLSYKIPGSNSAKNSYIRYVESLATDRPADLYSRELSSQRKSTIQGWDGYGGFGSTGGGGGRSGEMIPNLVHVGAAGDGEKSGAKPPTTPLTITTHQLTTPSTGRKSLFSESNFNGGFAGIDVGAEGSSPYRKKSKASSKSEAELMRWLESHELEEMFENLVTHGVKSKQSLCNPSITFTDDDLKEFGFEKKGIRMQFLATLKQLRSFKMFAMVVSGEGLPGGGFFSRTVRRRLSITAFGVSKMTGSSSEKKKANWNKMLTFGPITEENFGSAGDIVIELHKNNKKISEAIVPIEEIPRQQESDSRPFPLVNSKGVYSGIVHIKMWLERLG